MLRITPVEDRILVKPFEAEEVSQGGIVIPSQAQEKVTRGKVIYAGPGRYERGIRIPMQSKIDDTVVYGKYTGQEVVVNDEKLVVIRETDILVVLSEEVTSDLSPST